MIYVWVFFLSGVFMAVAMEIEYRVSRRRNINRRLGINPE